jgi:hypothetical protein
MIVPGIGGIKYDELLGVLCAAPLIADQLGIDPRCKHFVFGGTQLTRRCCGPLPPIAGGQGNNERQQNSYEFESFKHPHSSQNRA